MQSSGLKNAHHTLRLRVYYEDTDAAGIVYYANYLKFFERCCTEFLRARGVEQVGWLQDGWGFVVRRAQLEYLASAKLDDDIVITAQPERLGAASAWFAQSALRGSTLLATGRFQLACVDLRSGRPRPLPAEVVDALRAPAHTQATIEQ